MGKLRGYSKAIEILHHASSPLGFVASINDIDNYQRVWTRDGVFNGLAALMSGNDNLIETFRTTLTTIYKFQHTVGFIPSNVTAAGKVSFGGTAGRADNPSWAVIGLSQYCLFTGDKEFAEDHLTAVEKCFAVMEAWEFNGRKLMYVPQSGDWADEYFYHGYILFDQLLRLWALRVASKVYARDDWFREAETIEETISLNFWNNGPDKAYYMPSLKRLMTTAPSDYWLAGFNPSRIYSQFDLQANALALLLNLGDQDQKNTVINTLKKIHSASGTILPSFYPTIETNDWEMKDLESNYAYSFRNKPHEFHNGGLWPVWNGLLVNGLMQQNQTEFSQQIVSNLIGANEKNHWNFNECLHGQTLEPIGVPRCAWSAGGLIMAICATHGKKLFT